MQSTPIGQKRGVTKRKLLGAPGLRREVATRVKAIGTEKRPVSNDKRGVASIGIDGDVFGRIVKHRYRQGRPNLAFHITTPPGSGLSRIMFMRIRKRHLIMRIRHPIAPRMIERGWPD